MKQVFKVTNVNNAEEPKKEVMGNMRNAALREMLIPHFGTKVKVTKATMPKPAQPNASEGTKEEKL